MMVVVDSGSSYKYGIYLPDKSDNTTIAAFNIFHRKAETATGRKVQRLHTDWAYKSKAWEEYCQTHGITHEFTVPYSSAQNGLAEQVMRTTIDDVRTLLGDSGLGPSYWAKAAIYSIDTRNLIPSRQHLDNIPTEAFSGKQQNIAYLHVFGSRCWAKIPVAQGNSKLDPRSVECKLLGYASGSGNYRVQDVETSCVFILHDVVFKKGQPCHTSAKVECYDFLFLIYLIHVLLSYATLPLLTCLILCCFPLHTCFIRSFPLLLDTCFIYALPFTYFYSTLHAHSHDLLPI